MNQPHFKQLKGMVGKTWLYKGTQITIENYHILGDQGKTQIDLVGKDPVEVKDVTKFIEACLPVEVDPPVQVPSAALSTEVVQQTNGLLATLQQTLLDNIEMVKKDKEYIKQANVVNSSVNALIGMAKLQIQVGKMNGSKR